MRINPWLAFLAYLAFVVYGSLVPFQYRPHTWDEAWQLFLGIQYLNLGVVSRADWVANIVLYVPLAFLGCSALARGETAASVRAVAAVLVLAFCLAVAVAVEFSQLFFAPRTVSLNDLLAETLGSLGGILLWWAGRHRLSGLWRSFLSGGERSLLAAITGYLLLYLALALFPYDILLSLDELSWKLGSERVGWLVAGNCESVLRCSIRLLAEAVALAPLGLLVALYRPGFGLRRLLAYGLVLGVGLEFLQLLVASGTSQGLSVLFRAAGLGAGYLGGLLLRHHGLTALLPPLRGLVPWLLPPYLALAAAVSGWFSGPWLSPGQALDRLPDLQFMPFYYHYFSTEPVAMASLLANAALYGPLGLMVWLRRGVRPGGGSIAALWGFSLSLAMELGKLLLAPKHPDLTNPLIGAAAAMVAYSLALWLERVLAGGVSPVPAPTPVTADAAPGSSGVPPLPRGAANPLGLIPSAPFFLLLSWGFVRYPEGHVLLAAALVGYGVALWRSGSLWLLVLPALLPVLDLSPWTGRLLLDEFDLLILLTLALGYWRGFDRLPAPWESPLQRWAVILLLVSWALAMAMGLWPLLDEGEVLISSHSPLEAWMVGKGLLWALLLLPLLRRQRGRSRARARIRLVNGLVAGLALSVAAVLWQRHVFVGLLDFDNVFRVSGGFASMNTGGAYIEGFLALTFPVLVVWLLVQRRWWAIAGGLLLAALASYAMLVTFSRGGYGGLVAGLAVAGMGLWFRRGEAKLRRLLLFGGVSAVAVVLAVPILTDGFARERLGRVAQDMQTRLDHWERALGLMPDGPAGGLLGAGFGRYAPSYLWKADVPKPPGTYAVLEENGKPFLRLGAGESVFLDQTVAVRPDTRYRLSLRLRQPAGEASLKVTLCEKALLYSFDCVDRPLQPNDGRRDWQRLEADFDSGNLGQGGHWPHRPVMFSLHNSDPADAIDVAGISLLDPKGRELLDNGDFAAGVQHWLFVTDQDLAWHIHQTALEVFFAQGLLGLVALGLLLLVAWRNLRRPLLQGDPFATAMAAGLAGFLAVGLLGSTLDAARLSLGFYFCALAVITLVREPQQHSRLSD